MSRLVGLPSDLELPVLGCVPVQYKVIPKCYLLLVS